MIEWFMGLDIDDVGQVLSLCQRLFVAICMLFVTIPMLLNAYVWGKRGGLGPIRIMAAIGSLAIFCLAFYGLLNWIDIVFYDNTILGPPSHRWRYDLLVWTPLCVFAGMFLWVYRDTLKTFANRRFYDKDD